MIQNNPEYLNRKIIFITYKNRINSVKWDTTKDSNGIIISQKLNVKYSDLNLNKYSIILHKQELDNINILKRLRLVKFTLNKCSLTEEINENEEYPDFLKIKIILQCADRLVPFTNFMKLSSINKNTMNYVYYSEECNKLNNITIDSIKSIQRENCVIMDMSVESLEGDTQNVFNDIHKCLNINGCTIYKNKDDDKTYFEIFCKNDLTKYVTDTTTKNTSLTAVKIDKVFINKYMSYESPYFKREDIIKLEEWFQSNTHTVYEIKQNSICIQAPDFKFLNKPANSNWYLQVQMNNLNRDKVYGVCYFPKLDHNMYIELMY